MGEDRAPPAMKNLLVVTALLEGVTGVVLTVSPAPAVLVLVGAAFDTPGGLAAGRITGAALLALAVACWLARDDGGTRAARGVVAAMLLYDAATVAALVYAGVAAKVSAIGLWPAAVLHSAMALWCVVCLRRTKGQSPSEAGARGSAVGKS